jgi:hypothetical protein
MFRKLVIVLGATAAVAAAALAPTAASAHWHGGGWHGGWGHGWHGRGFGFGIYAPTFVAAPDCYLVKRVVATPYGYRVRRVQVCG